MKCTASCNYYPRSLTETKYAYGFKLAVTLHLKGASKHLISIINATCEGWPSGHKHWSWSGESRKCGKGFFSKKKTGQCGRTIHSQERKSDRPSAGNKIFSHSLGLGDFSQKPSQPHSSSSWKYLSQLDFRHHD